MAGPLAGMCVVSLEQAVAGPLASRHLADLGARVIKVERPGEGDFARHYDKAVKGMASHFVWLNRNKESVAVDLKNPDGRDLVEQLLGTADAYIQNLAPGSADALGLSATAICQRHPRIVACDISGYGSGGPFEDRRAYDLLVQAEAASIAVTGWPDRPAKPGIPVADIAAGMYAFSSILAGLLERHSTGKGRAISVSLFDAIAEWMGYTIYYSAYSGQVHQPSGLGHPSLSPYEAFETADGERVVVGVQNDREWRRLAETVMGRSDLAADESLATNAGRVAARERVSAECAKWFVTQSFAGAMASLDEAGIAAARLNGPEGLLAHPQLSERGRWVDVTSPVGDIRSLLPPTVSPGWEMRMDPIPDVGEHTVAVMKELGFDAAQIESFERSGATGRP